MCSNYQKLCIRFFALLKTCRESSFFLTCIHFIMRWLLFNVRCWVMAENIISGRIIEEFLKWEAALFCAHKCQPISFIVVDELQYFIGYFISCIHLHNVAYMVGWLNVSELACELILAPYFISLLVGRTFNTTISIFNSFFMDIVYFHSWTTTNSGCICFG